jgi:hypothetical protein
LCEGSPIEPELLKHSHAVARQGKCEALGYLSGFVDLCLKARPFEKQRQGGTSNSASNNQGFFLLVLHHDLFSCYHFFLFSVSVVSLFRI